MEIRLVAYSVFDKQLSNDTSAMQKCNTLESDLGSRLELLC